MTLTIPDPGLAPVIARDPGSYRDPSGFVYRRDGVLYRQVNASYAPHWDALVSSAFLDGLIRSEKLIPHEPAGLEHAAAPGAHAVILPESLEFISYPYEWTFGQLRDAALLTLEVQVAALAAGFTLKDASAYNVQFHRGRPILIDSLSFERATPDAPWIAYRQFCEHFLAPLALMAYRDVRAGLMLRDFIDGLPLDLASRLLPGRTRLRFGLLSHIHLHARAQRRYGDEGEAAKTRPQPKMSGLRQAALLDNLRATVERLSWTPQGTEWADYAEHTSYSDAATEDKDRLVRDAVVGAGGGLVWDLGANTGRFSRIASDVGRRVVAFDIDPAAAERHYRTIRRDDTRTILPLVMDLANPSPGLGWAGHERASLVERANADVVMALALVHHLAIGRNVPLDAISSLFAALAPAAIVEFVPKDDPMVRHLLATREDVFPDYTMEGFRRAVSRDFEILAENPIMGSPRTLVRLRRRS